MVVFGRFDVVRAQLVRLGIHSVLLDYIERLMDKRIVRRLAARGMPFREDIEEGQSYALFSWNQLGERASKMYESHRDHLDLHLVLEGEEYIEINDISLLKPLGAYHAENDHFLYENNIQGELIHLTPGMVAVFFPQDAHMPGLALDATKQSPMKLVIKQRVHDLSSHNL